jgi:hypothetical protein
MKLENTYTVSLDSTKITYLIDFYLFEMVVWFPGENLGNYETWLKFRLIRQLTKDGSILWLHQATGQKTGEFDTSEQKLLEDAYQDYLQNED